MKNKDFKMPLVILGSLVFNIVFWNEKIAVNALLFDAFILSSVFYLYPFSRACSGAKWLLAAHLITLGSLLIHNTYLSKLGAAGTLLLLVVFTQYAHRSVGYAAGSVFMNFAMAIPSIFGQVQNRFSRRFGFLAFGRYTRLLIIPSLLLLLFYALYSGANQVFSNLVADAGSAIESLVNYLFTWMSWQRLLFLLLGLLLTGALLLKSGVAYFADKDNRHSTSLQRTRRSLIKWQQSSWHDLIGLLLGKMATGTLALKQETRIALVSLLLLNLLLLVINVTDIMYVWFGFTYRNDINLSEFVHEGTEILLFSILLAMGLLLFFFRRNLNFYQGNRWLKMGAYIWLAQNAVLVVSVFFRDYYYIAHYGLAYKRIGVLFFLLMVLAGLITIFYKIYQRKTTYYLVSVNAWVAMILLVLACCIHWDETIARYNIARSKQIAVDVRLLLTLSDKVLPILQQHPEILAQPFGGKHQQEGTLLYRSHLDAAAVFEIRKKAFFDAQRSYSWLSWNLADQKVQQQLAPSAANVKTGSQTPGQPVSLLYK